MKHVGNGSSLLSCGPYGSGRQVGLSEFRPGLQILTELISWEKKIKINACPLVPDIKLLLGIGGGGLF